MARKMRCSKPKSGHASCMIISKQCDSDLGVNSDINEDEYESSVSSVSSPMPPPPEFCDDFHLSDASSAPSEDFSAVLGWARSEEEEESGDDGFAGVRVLADVRHDSAVITSRAGTVRGVRNRVRQGIATFLRNAKEKDWCLREQNKVVVYTTSLGVHRETFARCLRVRQILTTLMVRVEERDIFMSSENRIELRERTKHELINVPTVFVNGHYLGDAEMIERLNERGELRELLRPFRCSSVRSECSKCGGFRMLPCQICRGSKKSVHRNSFTESFVALRCGHCDDSALVRCDLCISNDENNENRTSHKRAH